VEIDDDKIPLTVIPLLAVCELGAPWTGYDSENWSGAEISPATCRTKDEGNLNDQPRCVGLQGWHWLDPLCPSISCKPGKVDQTMAFKADTKTSRHQENAVIGVVCGAPSLAERRKFEAKSLRQPKPVSAHSLAHIPPAPHCSYHATQAYWQMR
jgi:hypothetical protein